MEQVNSYEHFDPEDYLELFYLPDFEFKNSLFAKLHEYFQTGMLTGKTMLDIGTGPIPTTAMFAAEYYDEIYLSDFTKANREFLNAWLTKEKTDVLRPIFEAVARTRGSGSSAGDIENTLRRKIKSISYCDITQPNPIYPLELPLFDLVASTFCIEDVISNTHTLKSVLHNISNVLKPGGFFIQAASDATFYDMGGKNYRMNVQRNALDDRILALEEAGYQVLRWTADFGPTPQELKPVYDGQTFFSCLAKKK